MFSGYSDYYYCSGWFEKGKEEVVNLCRMNQEVLIASVDSFTIKYDANDDGCWISFAGHHSASETTKTVVAG